MSVLLTYPTAMRMQTIDHESNMNKIQHVIAEIWALKKGYTLSIFAVETLFCVLKSLI